MRSAHDLASPLENAIGSPKCSLSSGSDKAGEREAAAMAAHRLLQPASDHVVGFARAPSRQTRTVHRNMAHDMR